MSYNEKIHLAYSKSPDRSARGMRRRMPQRTVYLAGTLILLLFFYLIHRSPNSTKHAPAPINAPSVSRPPSKAVDADLDCRHLPGVENVLVVMKTGSTEIQDKLPIHFNTTLRCYPEYMIFSDYEEEFMGHKIHDALKWTTPKIKEENGDFELWRRLQKGGRAALKPSELSGPVSRVQSNNAGKPSNPGWKLDKWKFLPMVNQTYHAHPDKRWYMFVETDTYIMWQSVLNYMKALDETKRHYIGGQAWIGDIQFNHGGTGFIVTNSALKAVVEMFQDHQDEWEDFTNKHWAGDCVLGKAMKDSGSPPQATWPIWQGDDIGQMTWWREDAGNKRLWCAPAVSFHHVGPGVIESLWNFEQNYISNVKDPARFMRYKDLYYDYVMPRVTKNQMKLDWDNHAVDDKGPVDDLEGCRRICEADTACLQFVLTADMRCSTSIKPNLGETYRGVDSGWMPERMQKWGDNMKACTGNDWMWV